MTVRIKCCCCRGGAEFKKDPGATLHLWSSDDPWTTVTAHSNPDSTYSGTFSLKTGGFLGER
jgi:ubiquitin carboxyl-terminal hydrolase 48